MTAPMELPQPGPAARSRLAWLDGLRACAVVAVILHHLRGENLNGHTLHGPWLYLTNTFLYGHFAVAVFIVISGYCLTLPLPAWRLKGSVWTFYARRCRRILPTYYLSILFCVIVLHLFAGPVLGRLPDARNLLAHIFLVHNLSLQTLYGISGPYWSIAVEGQIYLVFPLLLWLWRTRAWLWGSLALIAGLTWLCGRLESPPTELLGLSPQYYVLFMLGAGAVALARRYAPAEAHGRARVRALCAAGSLASPALFLCFWGKFGTDAIPVYQWALDYLIGLGAAALLVFLTLSPEHGLTRLLSTPSLARVGEYSYSVYLIHDALVIVLVDRLIRAAFGHAPDVWQFTASVAFVLPAILLISRAFFVLCERPFLYGAVARPPRDV